MEEGGGENQVKREGGGGEAMSIKVKDQSGGEVSCAFCVCSACAVGEPGDG